MQPYGKIVSTVLSLDPDIRYASVMDKSGKLIDGGMRVGKSALEPDEESGKLLVQARLAGGMSESWERYFGKLRYILVAHGKVNVFEFPMKKDDGEFSLIVTAEPSIGLDIAERILDILKKS